MPSEKGRQIIPAATVVIFRKGVSTGQPPQLLMLQRARAMRFAGGATVFPGGQVDPEDRVLARRLLPDQPEELRAARVAAIRETLEETGLLIASPSAISAQAARDGREQLRHEGALAPVLERMNWTLEPERLAFFAHWCPARERAFDTRFFVTDLGTGEVDIRVDETENTRLFWATAGETLDRAQRGALQVIFPTLRNLERLATYARFEDALNDVKRHPPRRIQPWIERRSDGEWLLIPEDLGYPVCAQPLETAQRG